MTEYPVREITFLNGDRFLEFVDVAPIPLDWLPECDRAAAAAERVFVFVDGSPVPDSLLSEYHLEAAAPITGA